MEVAPAVVAEATALAISSVPLANAGISKTPMGPFQTMVLARAISEAYAATVFGPISRPIWSAGVAETSTVVALASGFNSGATTWSVGRRGLKFFCLASGNRRLARA